MNTYRTTARVVGIVYVAGLVIGIGGMVLIQSFLGAPDHLSAVSASSMLLAIGAVLWLMPAAGDAAHGVLMFPILKQQHSERIAIGYLGFRIVNAVFIAVMVLFILLQIPLASEYIKAAGSDASFLQALSSVFMEGQLYAYNIGMSAVGIASLMLCYTLQGKVGSEACGRMGPHWIRDHSLRVFIRSLRVQSAYDPRDSGWPVGAVHRGVAYRQRIQSICICFRVYRPR